ncbi:MAG: hypothetical protein E7187_07010 [Erysipelotrichaceae bacterium]|nr:hypothetical protein [Erysipelotrichaceae bacterium]
MRNKLKANSVIWFDPAENGTFKHYLKITDCIGEGGTGIVYTGIDDNGIVWVVKESFPNTENSVLNNVHVYRRGDGNISAYADNDYYDLNTEINRILENENDVALILQNDLTNKIMNMPFYNGILKGAAIQCPGQSFPVTCNQMFSRMQYVKGVTADKVGFSDTLARLRAVEDILKAIAGIHQAGFILGDIKPQNIMIADGGNGRCFVLDYGSAVKTDANRVANIDPLTYPRSSGYIGPELYDMADGHAYLTKAYDVYSLGALLMDLLMPQRTKTIREIQYRQRMEFHYRFLYEDLEAYGAFSRLSIMQELPVSPALADELSRILQKCLADDREERYQDAGELLEDYSRFLNNYQYKTVKPDKYDYHLLWQASYDFLVKRLNNTLEGRTRNINDNLSVRKKPEWWELESVAGQDLDGNIYPDATDIVETLKQEHVYMYASGGMGKTMKACQIMLRCLWEMPVLYVDCGLWSDRMDSDYDLSADEIFSHCYLDYSCLPDGFTEYLKTERFLIIMDNINNISPLLRDDLFKVIGSLQSEFREAEILLIGRNENLDDNGLDASFKKIKLRSIEGEENRLLKIPFFYMLYQKMKHDKPEFVLDTVSEVRFLETYMESLGTDYYKHEREIMEIALAMAEGLFYRRYIYKTKLEAILRKYDSEAELKKVMQILTDKLGLLVPLSGLYSNMQYSQLSLNDEDTMEYGLGLNSDRGAYEFAHDIYQDYFTARRIAELIKVMVARGTLEPFPVFSAYRWNHDVVSMMMSFLSEEELDELYNLLSKADNNDSDYDGIIRSLAGYYWYYENHTVNRWAELGAKHDDDYSRRITEKDLPFIDYRPAVNDMISRLMKKEEARFRRINEKGLPLIDVRSVEENVRSWLKKKEEEDHSKGKK